MPSLPGPAIDNSPSIRWSLRCASLYCGQRRLERLLANYGRCVLSQVLLFYVALRFIPVS
jgi:hypothetical protein